MNEQKTTAKTISPRSAGAIVRKAIYLNREKSESFGIPYAALTDIPESEREFKINTLTLWAHDPGSWDDEHKSILFPERYVTLRAKDYGWWEVVEPA